MDSDNTELKEIVKKNTEEKTRRMRNAFITINYDFEDEKEIEEKKAHDIEEMKHLEHKYIVIGEHTGEKSKIKHIHALIEFKDRLYFTQIKAALPRARIETRKGTPKQARIYVNKEKKILFEEGTMSTQGKGFHEIIEMIEQKEPTSEIIRSYPEEYIRYHAGIKSAIEELKEKVCSVVPHDLRQWQKDIITIITSPTDERKINWVVDVVGGKGKTWLAKYIINEYKAAYFTNAKTADVAYAYNGENICIFDLCRSSEDLINYQIIEMIKNGLVFSSKYASSLKVYQNPHVVVFSNFAPNRSKLSDDRWNIIYI